ncbi:MAG: gamma-butyrobetaine hydroxylase-like domain-containing protein [Candidatus Binatia bacterium]
MVAVIPTEINHIKGRGLVRITWDDGHIGEYPESYLRGYCPCAVCQGHGAERRFIEVPDAKLVGISAVGNYAIELYWQDGHSTGIYTYEYLRSLCVCPKCQSEQSRRA